MSFVSLAFVIFLPVALLLTRLARGFWLQLIHVVLGFSFVAWLSVDYAVIMGLVLAIAWLSGLVIAAVPEESPGRKLALAGGIIATGGMLMYFKYFGFLNCVAGSVSGSCEVTSYTTLANVLLPLGISFYTLQAVGYVIDVYRDHRVVERNLVTLAAFIVYFPQLVAGPIERSANLLPQLRDQRRPRQEEIDLGVRLIVWGLFKKVVIADQLTQLVDPVYAAPGSYGGLVVLLATVAFAIQIYCDFSGYTDIAIGVARLMGITLMRNFDRPYFATNIQDFWRRWHMSLSTWFRDYLYTPLGGSRRGLALTAVNLLVVFVASGLWHGANWTFLIWGLVHGVCIAAYVLINALRARRPSVVPTLPKPAAWLLTIGVVVLAWVFFRATSISKALVVLESIILRAPIDFISWITSWSPNGLTGFLQSPANQPALIGFTAAGFVFLVEASKGGRQRQAPVLARHPAIDFAAYFALVLASLAFGEFGRTAFIYFQF